MKLLFKLPLFVLILLLCNALIGCSFGMQASLIKPWNRDDRPVARETLADDKKLLELCDGNEEKFVDYLVKSGVSRDEAVRRVLAAKLAADKVK